MKSRLTYVELKTGFAHNGPAWIGKAFFSKSGRTTYFDGKVLSSGSRGAFDIETGQFYWISGVKKDGTDRHIYGNGKIMIDKSVIAEYLQHTGLTELPRNKFEIVELNNVPARQKSLSLFNEKL